MVAFINYLTYALLITLLSSLKVTLVKNYIKTWIYIYIFRF